MEQESEADGDRGRRGGFKETAGMEGRQTRGWAGALFDAEYEAPLQGDELLPLPSSPFSAPSDSNISRKPS